MAEINWNLSREDFDLLSKIADRAVGIAIEAKIIPRTKRSEFNLKLQMDVAATHANGCPLKLADLLCAPPFDFAHDIFGIRRHIDRETGHLKDCFLPRYAIPRLESQEFLQHHDVEDVE